MTRKYEIRFEGGPWEEVTAERYKQVAEHEWHLELKDAVMLGFSGILYEGRVSQDFVDEE